MAVNTKDKYYSPDWLVEHTIKKAIEILGYDNISDIIEPSAGDGAFIEMLKKYFPDKLQYYYDLYPEHPEVKEQDFKELRKSYKRGRLVIGNPPFGISSSLWKSFCRKSARIADYIAFVSPASQYNSNYYFKEGVLVYSELLNDVEYRGSETEGGKAQKVRTCLNIYKVYDREENNWREDKIRQIVKYGRSYKDDGILYDYYLSSMTNGEKTLLNLCNKEDFYGTFGVTVLDEKYRSKIEEFLKNFKQYEKELRNVTTIHKITNGIFYDKISKFLYPTREERLEQEVLTDILYSQDDFEDYPESHKPVHVEREFHALQLF